MTRVDAWIWAVRLVKTRPQAAEACKAGHVKVNGVSVKPSHAVAPGDRVRVWVDHRQFDVEVVDDIRRRVGASVARDCYVDHSPPPRRNSLRPCPGVIAVPGAPLSGSAARLTDYVGEANVRLF